MTPEEQPDTSTYNTTKGQSAFEGAIKGAQSHIEKGWGERRSGYRVGKHTANIWVSWYLTNDQISKVVTFRRPFRASTAVSENPSS